MTTNQIETEKRYNDLTAIFGKDVSSLKTICVHTLAYVSCPSNQRHCRICKFDHYTAREHAMISMPYGLSKHEMKVVLDTCEQYHLAFIISAELSYRAIGRSVLIAIYNPTDVTNLHQHFLT